MKLTLKTKILFAFLFVGLVPLITIGFYSYWKSSQSLEASSIAKLQSINSLKSRAVENYFALLRAQAKTLAHNQGTKEGFKKFTDAFGTYLIDNKITLADSEVQKESLKKFYSNEFGAEYAKQNQNKTIDTESLLNDLTNDQYALQIDYIVNNPNKLGSKHLQERSSKNTNYDNVHAYYHTNFRENLEKFEFYDIFLIDAKTGNIVYSVYKEVDFATSLKTGPYKNSGLAKIFNRAMDLTNPEDVVVEDYDVYRPSYDGPAGFVATPIWVNGEKIGVLAFQISFDKINSLTLQQSGNEKTLETYLIGSDFKMRSDAVADHEHRNVRASFRNPEKGSIESPSIRSALSGETISEHAKDYFGEDSLISSAPLNVPGLKWMIQSVHRTKEALDPIAQLKNAFLIVGISFFVLISLFAIWFDRSIVSALIQSIAKVANDLKREAASINVVSKSSAEIATSLSEATTEQAASLQETVASIDEISAMVTRNADSSSTSAKMSEQSQMIAQKGKEKASDMMDSINAIAIGNEKIIAQIQESNKEFTEIVNVIQEISIKTQVINDIVFQTKLLSFNASVEAARAGENGKGFAVVAEEVGNLASMSGTAASEITGILSDSVKKVTDIVDRSKRLMDNLIVESKSRIESGTRTSQECMNALDEILSKVSAVNNMVGEISTASVEQSTGIREVNKAMSEMDQVTQSNSSIAQESSRSAQELQSQATRLNNLVKDLSLILGNKSEDIKEVAQASAPAYEEAKVIKLRPNQGKEKVRKPSVDSIPDSKDSRFEDA
jgi:methyl-accepting chemotaxis protein